MYCDRHLWRLHHCIGNLCGADFVPVYAKQPAQPGGEMTREYIVSATHDIDDGRWACRWLNQEQADYLRSCGWQVDPVINTIPQWVARLRLARVWVWLQDKGVIRL